MMHEEDEFSHADAPSRSHLRRAALDVLKLAHALAALTEAQLARLPLDEQTCEQVRVARAVRSHIARKRAEQFLAKQLRLLGDAALEPIHAALGHDRAHAAREAARLHRAEAWRERLIAADDALHEFTAAHPHADADALRELVRRGRAERASARPPTAWRQLFREIREILQSE